MVVVKLLARSDCVTISSGPFVVFIELAVCMICELILLADTVGVKRELSIMSFLNQSKQLMHTFIHNNWQIKRSFLCKGKRKVIFLHDNARPLVAKTTREKVENQGWEVLPQPAYSPDLAPSDYHLFRSMQHFLPDEKLHGSWKYQKRPGFVYFL